MKRKAKIKIHPTQGYSYAVDMLQTEELHILFEVARLYSCFKSKKQIAKIMDISIERVKNIITEHRYYVGEKRGHLQQWAFFIGDNDFEKTFYSDYYFRVILIERQRTAERITKKQEQAAFNKLSPCRQKEISDYKKALEVNVERGKIRLGS